MDSPTLFTRGNPDARYFNPEKGAAYCAILGSSDMDLRAANKAKTGHLQQHGRHPPRGLTSCLRYNSIVFVKFFRIILVFLLNLAEQGLYFLHLLIGFSGFQIKGRSTSLISNVNNTIARPYPPKGAGITPVILLRPFKILPES